ncbi:hypothetical protein CHLRE_01g015250v5 [Chlamydomonas reinhardtii]|uniref:DNA polymerase n=1 Tax=Chlamydomonas reinhardtii TaxID=3055 RepID=A0A2K3E5T4_CHLRE|nr:uncharacterized protein CHLRE_01g015250v5 [Chlamydomonas reinhardtii]PNW88124.1 hypothetical protein CHLRE_01g015250v5 [Chlamydomonas reinhardtii]
MADSQAKRYAGGGHYEGGPPAKRQATGPDPDDMDFIEDDPSGPPEPLEDVELGEAGRNWVRPPVADFDPASTAIVFQQLEVDYYLAEPRAGVDTVPVEVKQVPVLRLFGVNAAGNSVCALVHGFEPYFLIERRPHWGADHIQALGLALNQELLGKAKGVGGPAVTRIEPAERRSIWNFQPPGTSTAFLKIVVSVPNLVAPARGLLEGGMSLSAVNDFVKCTTYESNVLFTLRFMVDCKVVGGNWVELPAGAYQLETARPMTHCQIEAHIRYDKLISHAPDGEYSSVAPLRIMSIDIECCGRKGCFPEAKIDPVIQIASMVSVSGKMDGPVVKNIMTLGSCASIVGAEVMSFNDEAEMLLRWRDLLVESDPDIIIGYNILNFDLPYLYERADALKIGKKFQVWGRVRGSHTRMRDGQFSSKAYGTHEYKDITIEGRVQFDLLTAIQRDHKLSSYSLNSVSAHFLGEQKEDVHHSAIADLQAGNEETRRRLAVYCLKDAYLPQRLLDKLMYTYNYIEMARVTGVPLSYLLTRGQSIKVFSQLLRKAAAKGFVIPNIKVQGPVAGADGVGYEGATVLDPKIGFYDRPVATLDFASLYPSIMMAHNLCYTTLLTKDQLNIVPPEDREQSPSGDWFVRNSRQRGLLPEILEELLAARKRAKNDLKAEKDPFKRAVLDGRQLALKVSANSVYGFTGATVGKMPCLAISASTTSYGREMIMTTRQLVQEHYTRANGYETDCEVIYGDTDSVMVNFKVADVARAMELGREAAAVVSKAFPPPVKLEFEKVYYPYLLMNKKRYAGLLWTRPETHDKMDSKGIETVRRDNCLLVRNVVTTCLERILIGKDVQGAVGYVKGVIADLLMNKIDLSLLVISKGLTQDADEYEGKIAHVELAKKMRKRDPATAPAVGDRVPYVIIKAAKGAKAWEKAEDPIYALEHSLPIDVQHYLEHHLSQPLLRIFEPVMKNPKELLCGDHTRCIAVSTPSTAAGGIMRFAKVTMSCLACKAPLPSGCKDSLCGHCKPQEAEIYSRTLGTVSELEAQYGALWTACQRCQGSLHMDVLCTSRDCPIFYRRKKVQKDLNEAMGQLDRFDATSW